MTDITETTSVMKQLSITIGFFLSFYKEVHDLMISPVSDSLDNIFTRFKIDEVFTDIDQVQLSIASLENYVH